MPLSEEERKQVADDAAAAACEERDTLHGLFTFRHDTGEEEALLVACDSIVSKGCRIVSVASFPVPIVDEDGRRFGVMREVLFRTG